MAKILLWDIESTDLIADKGICICIGYKFLGEKTTHVMSILEFKDSIKDGKITDKHLLKVMYPVLSQADMWVTWYGKRFDVPFVSTRLLEFGMSPLPPIPHLDGWEVARYRLKLHSNRLASISAFLNLDDKTPVKLNTWRDAATGHKPSIKYIIDHCRKDVEVLEQAYEKIKPFSKVHPNILLMDNITQACPTCGTKGKLQRRGEYISIKYRYHRYHCESCGSWTKGERITNEKSNH